MKHIFSRVIASVLLLTLCIAALPACASLGEELLVLEKDGISVSISVNQYELLLSRAKGKLCAAQVTQNGTTAASSAFWEYKDKFDGTTFETYAEFYERSILNTCKMHLVAKYLFEKEGLSLSAEQEAEVDSMMEELVKTDGGGSETKLNKVLADFGVNYDILRDFYETEMKVQAVKDHLYGANASKVGNNVKHEYMNAHFVRFRQIFLTSKPYVYETDDTGEVIYYQTETGKTNRIYYDSANGEAKQLEDGSFQKDKNGDTIYYVKNSNYTMIAYNVKGDPHHLVNSDGSYKTRDMTTEELEKLDARAKTLFEKVQNASTADFESTLVAESDGDTDVSQYNEGVYLRTDLDYSLMGEDSAYLADIVSALQEMEVGEVRKIMSPSGYHIIRKYANTESAYSKAENEDYFSTFNANLINSLFLEECQKHTDAIVVDEELLTTAPSIKAVGINYYY